MSIMAESLAWETGAWPKGAPGSVHLRAADGMVERLTSRLARWLKSTEPKPFKFRPAPDQKKLDDKIVSVIDHEQMTAIVEVLDPILAAEYVAVLQAASTAAQAAWPRYDIPGLVPESAPLSADDLAEAWSVIQVMESPDRILEEFESWTVTPSQIGAFRTVFPEISASIDAALGNAMVDMAVKKQRVSWQVEDLLRLWKQAPPETPVIAALAAPQAPDAPAAPTAKSTIISSANTAEQAAQRRKQT